MKRFVLFLLLLSSSFSQYGSSTVVIERTWNITADGDDLFYLKGAMAVNNTNQRVSSIAIEPSADYRTSDDGVVLIHYIGKTNGSVTIKGTAIVDIDYDTDVYLDAPVPNTTKEQTELTAADDAIASQALSLADPASSLTTIVNMVNWVKGYMTYDEAYWDKVKSAKEVFSERRGACAQHTTLLISMARSLGFDTRYVSGYVHAQDWQPHAWAEIYIPGYGWLPADPTFGQVGVLDNSYVAVNHGDDQLSVYDVLVSKSQNATLEVNDDIRKLSSSARAEDIDISIGFDSHAYTIDVTLSNDHPEYAFGKYQFLSPEEYGITETAVVLLKPGQTIHRYYGLNHSLFSDSYSYNIPAIVMFNDAMVEKTLTVNNEPEPCYLPFAFLCLISLKILSV